MVEEEVEKKINCIDQKPVPRIVFPMLSGPDGVQLWVLEGGLWIVGFNVK